MTNKWNASEIKANGLEFTKVICDEFFKDKENIEGADIINLTEIKQLNFFVLKNLFEKWKDEVGKLKSPYFDFSNQEVKKALDDFMNVLSRHILISRSAFEPLLSKAFTETVTLFQEPKSFFVDLMRNLPDFKLSQSWLEENGKFFASYNWVLREISAKLAGQPQVFANEAMEWVGEIINEINVEDHTKDLDDLAKIIGFSPKMPANESNPYQSFFDSIEAYKQSKSTSTNDSEPSLKEPENLASAAMEEEVPAMKPELKIENTVSEINVNNIVTEDLNDSQNTLNDILQKSKDVNSLSDFHQKKKIDSIGGSISLNQKFLFINNLFGSKPEVFNAALQELETSNSFQEAKDLMLKKYMPAYKWNLNSPETEEFLELLKRRFN